MRRLWVVVTVFVARQNLAAQLGLGLRVADSDIDAAEEAAKAALLESIKTAADGTNVPSQLKDLATAYALTVGARWGYLPGGVPEVRVSK